MNDSQHIGDQGEFWFALQLPKNWFWQPPRRDFGKDGHVVVRDGSELHNLEFAIQVKTTRQPEVRDGHVIKSGVSRSSVYYWFASPIPTLVVAVDIEAGRAWYIWHMDLFDSPRQLPRGDTKTITIQIPESNRLDQDGWADIRERLSRFYSGLQRALRVADASSKLSPIVRTLVLAVRNLASVSHLPENKPNQHPDIEPILALHEQTQHRDILAAVRLLLRELQHFSEATKQIQSWTESYEATALLAYPFLRELPEGDEFGPDVKIGVATEIVPEVRARLMTAGLDMIWSLMSGRAPLSKGLNQHTQ